MRAGAGAAGEGSRVGGEATALLGRDELALGSEKAKADGALAPERVEEDDTPVQYRYSGMAYAIMLFLGVGMLTVWNIVLNSITYFQWLYPAQQEQIAFYLSLAYTYPGLPILFLMVRYGSRYSLKWRILGVFLFQVAIMALMPVLAPTHLSVLLIVVFVSGLANNVLQSSLLGFASIFPPAFNQGCMAGQGIAGVIASGAQILVKGATTSQQDSSGQLPDAATRDSAIAYFAFAAVVMAACAAAYLCLLRMPFAQFYIARAQSVQEEGKDATPSPSPVPAGDEEIGTSVSGSSAALLARGASSGPSIMAVLRKTWAGQLGVFSVFFMTFLVFPGVVLGIDYKGSFGEKGSWLGDNNSSWWSVLLLAQFNVFDTMGRTLASKLTCVPERMQLPAVALRFLLIPLFFGCYKSWTAGFDDALALILNTVFSFTNGYLASLCIMRAPARVAPAEKEMAGFLLSLFLNLGIISGTTVALAFTPQ